MTLQITIPFSCDKNKNICNCNRDTGFTLVELVVVMVIIAIISAIAIPHSANHYSNIQAKRDCLCIKEYLVFCIQKTQSENKKYRFVIDISKKAYWLEFFDNDSFSFVPIPGAFGSPRKLAKDTNSITVTGFKNANNVYSLIYDPDKPWPVAELAICLKERTCKININARSIQTVSEHSSSNT